MPLEFHSDPKKKWEQQYLVTRDHILPFVQGKATLPERANILEVGCGEGGVLKAFCEAGYLCHGVDLAENRIRSANELLAAEVEQGTITFYAGNVHDTELFAHLKGNIDLLILKDAIEHIPEQEKILRALRSFLKPGGLAFVAFPPWRSPFGGHQQLADSRLKYLPWFHILPKTLYRTILRLAGETETQIGVLMEIYDTRLPTSTFERHLRAAGWRIQLRRFFLFNPIYEYKFGIRGKKQFATIAALPHLRDFLSTGVYYLLR